jgi:beta-lactamase regulating signal transducer with metallopeptidase domain
MNVLVGLLPPENLLAGAIRLLALVTGLIIAAAMTAALARRAGAAVRHGVWLCALVAILLSPLAIVAANVFHFRIQTLPWPLSPRVGPAEEEATAPLTIAAPFGGDGLSATLSKTDSAGLLDRPPAEPRVAAGNESEPPEDAPPLAGDWRPPPELPPALPTGDEADWPMRLGRLGLAFWTAGFLVLLGRYFRGLFLLRVLRRSARPLASDKLHNAVEQARLRLGIGGFPSVAVSPSLSSPAAIGVTRPLVVLPEGLIDELDPPSLQDVLVHEAAHLIRRDPLVGLLQRLVEVLYWPHPLVHLLNRRLARAREEICDNFVVQHGDPCRFARTLLALSERAGVDRRLVGSLPLMNARWKLEDRVAGLLDPRRKVMTRMSRGTLAIAALLMLATSVALAGVRIGEPDQENPRDPSPELGSAPAPPALEAPPRQIRGLVVDASTGKRVGGAIVRSGSEWRTIAPATTAADGSFAVEVRGPIFQSEVLLATTADGRLQGMGTLEEPMDCQAQAKRVEIVLQPCRAVDVMVTDAKGAPVSDAIVALHGGSLVIEGKTSENGRATIQFRAGTQVEQVVALKSGVGFDYFENYSSWPSRGKTELPRFVPLVLRGAQSGHIRAVDSRGKPIAGVAFHVWLVRKPGKLAEANLGAKCVIGQTDAEGRLSFDWLPTDLEEPARVMPMPGPWHAPGVIVFPLKLGDAPTTVRMTRKPTLKGRVVRPDGTPAAGVLIEAQGVGKDAAHDSARDSARTGPDGFYSFAVPPGYSYMVGVRDASWAAESLRGIVLRRECENRELPPLRLIKGALIQAKLTRGAENAPAAGQWITLREDGDPLPNDYQTLTMEGRESLTWGAKTDVNGECSYRVAPGKYQLDLGQREREAIEVQAGDVYRVERQLQQGEETERSIKGLMRDQAVKPRIPEKAEGTGAARPRTTASGPSRSEIADLIRTIGRDPVSAAIVDRIVAMYHPRFLWSLDFDRMKQVATDPAAFSHLDRLSQEVQGKRLDTLMLLRAASMYHRGYDDAMMKQMLRQWIAEAGWPVETIRGSVVEAETGKPIPFPHVYSDESIASTDQEGKFEIRVRRRPGSTKPNALWLEADGFASGHFLVKDGREPRITLEHDAPFFGMVVDHEGKPLAGAEVRARVHPALVMLGDATRPEEIDLGLDSVFQVRTDHDGRFSFRGVPERDFAHARARAREVERKLEHIFRLFLTRDHEFNDPRWPVLIQARDVAGDAAIDVTFKKRSGATFSSIVHAKRVVPLRSREEGRDRQTTGRRGPEFRQIRRHGQSRDGNA